MQCTGYRTREYFMEFDFDAWKKLAKDDPAEFERRRDAILQETIEKAPPAFRQRLERLQGRLDRERHRSTPTRTSCVRMNTLLWVGFYRLRKELNETSATTAAGRASPPTRSAQIIPLRARLTAGHSIGQGGNAES